MSLFDFGKKKEQEQKTPVCSCSCEISAGKAEKSSDSCCGNSVKGICCVKVLGAGCKSCHEQYENTKKALMNMGIAVEAEYITDMAKVMEYGVMRMPAIVVNEKVVSMGKVLKTAEIEEILRKYEL